MKAASTDVRSTQRESVSEIESIAFGLDALQTMRSHGKALYDAYVDRLTKATRQPAVSPDDVEAAAPIESPKARWGDVQRWMQRWPDYRAQEKALRGVKRNGRTLAVAIASSRLHDPAVPSPRSQLKRLSKSLIGRGIDGQIDSADTVLLFEPAFESASWDDRAVCHAENAFIIDTGFLLYLLVTSPAASTAATARTVTRLPGILARWTRLSTSAVLIASLIRRAYRLLLDGFSNIEAVLLTSNSHATEVLRVHLMQSRACSGITEILHGVPTVEVEQYFDRILELDGVGAASKHFFIEQIPGLITDGTLASRKREGTAINPYVNRYFAAHQLIGEGRNQSIRREIDNLGLRDGDVILTFGGGMAVHRRRYFGSRAFEAECRLMTEMANHLKRRPEPFRLLYAVHPLFLPHELEQCTFFRDHNITVCRNTVFTWLVSDFFASLLSSAMFEAAYFGAKAFAPITVADGYFSPYLLRSLCHPADGDSESLEGSVASFLSQGAQVPSPDLLKRAEDRLDRLFAHHCVLNPAVEQR